MSLIRNNSYTWLDACSIKLLKCASIPRHVAFIMDGNRRFARKTRRDVVEGHREGAERFSDIIQWSLDLGVKVITVYAFSTLNFTRPSQEVEGLMTLLRIKLNAILDDLENVRRRGLRVKIIGTRSYLPDDVLDLIERVEKATARHGEAVLHLAIAYSGQEEIEKSVNEALKCLKDKQLTVKDVNVNLLTRLLDTGDSEMPELLIRTGGDMRLSDFLLWQASFSYLHFTDIFWPEFTLRHYLWAIFKCQRLGTNLKEHSFIGKTSVNTRCR